LIESYVKTTFRRTGHERLRITGRLNVIVVVSPYCLIAWSESNGPIPFLDSLSLERLRLGAVVARQTTGSGLTNDQIIGDVMGSAEYFQRTTAH